MIVLDTNVISEAMRGPRGDLRIRHWVSALEETPVITVINRAEILTGIAMLPAGARRERLTLAATAAFAQLGVVLPLTPDAADHFATIVASRRRSGRPIGSMDALIAAICLTAGATLATRDVRDYDGLGLAVINPWG